VRKSVNSSGNLKKLVITRMLSIGSFGSLLDVVGGGCHGHGAEQDGLADRLEAGVRVCRPDLGPMLRF
jgi:hypothetical protein